MANTGGANAWYTAVTPGGHLVHECPSAMQKCIRLSQPDEAVYFAAQLCKAGFANYVWKRLAIICVEDIGPVNPTLPATIHALHQMWLAQMKQKHDHAAQSQLFVVHAVTALAASPKSRLVDDLRIHHFETPESDCFVDMPDAAVDRHCARGKRAGRDIHHFVEVGSRVVADGFPLTDDWLAAIKARGDADLIKKFAGTTKDAPGRYGTPPYRKPTPPASHPEPELFAEADDA